MRGCIKSTMTLVLVNRSPNEKFHMSKGLKTRWPTSSILVFSYGRRTYLTSSKKQLLPRVQVGKKNLIVDIFEFCYWHIILWS